MESILPRVVQSVQKSEIAFSKYITANDVGATGAHQAGFHVAKNAWELFFDEPGIKGSNKDKFITIKWQDDFETSSRVIYYGAKTRNEYRLTRFGRGFPYLTDDNIGDLLVISKKSSDYFEGFVLQSDEDIDDFFAAFNISPSETNGIIPRQFELSAEEKLLQCFGYYLLTLKTDFPSTVDLASNARNCYNNSFGIIGPVIKNHPDREILNWLDAEFQLFKVIEGDMYKTRIGKPFESIEELVETANTILNRRKSRAGKSLEHHLGEIFRIFELQHTKQAVTEDKKTADFLFPGEDAYHDSKFPDDKLVMLAAKTTCKDRWRQVLNEADRIKTKHLFTLQQGISSSQLEEMYKYNVCLVVPKQFHKTFPERFRPKILSLESFVRNLSDNQKL